MTRPTDTLPTLRTELREQFGGRLSGRETEQIVPVQIQFVRDDQIEGTVTEIIRSIQLCKVNLKTSTRTLSGGEAFHRIVDGVDFKSQFIQPLGHFAAVVTRDQDMLANRVISIDQDAPQQSCGEWRAGHQQ